MKFLAAILLFFRLKRLIIFFFYLTFVFNDCFLKFLYQIEFGGDILSQLIDGCKNEMVPGNLQENSKIYFESFFFEFSIL